LRRLLRKPIAQGAAVPGADAYRKHFPATAHRWFLLWHGLSAAPSLRQSHAIADADPVLWTRLGLPPGGISRSQLARSSTSRPPACLAAVFAALPRPGTALPKAWGDIRLIDSTFLTLSATLAPWSQYGKHAPGVRVHPGYDLGRRVPTDFTFTLADHHDVRAFRERDWTDLVGWTVIVDLAYYAHRTFAALRAAKVSWVCRLHDQARHAVTAAQHGPWLPTAAGDQVLTDQVITLGSPNNRNGAVLPAVRLITSRNAEGTRPTFVTDRHDLPPTDIVPLSRHRWPIELFFRFLKHHLGVLRPLGQSPAAIALTFWLAAIVALLLVVLDADRPAHLSAIAWVRALGHLVHRVIHGLRGG
jgi:hypothetical protein